MWRGTVVELGGAIDNPALLRRAQAAPVIPVEDGSGKQKSADGASST
jgi:hypothetical protein